MPKTFDIKRRLLPPVIFTDDILSKEQVMMESKRAVDENFMKEDYYKVQQKLNKLNI